MGPYSPKEGARSRESHLGVSASKSREVKSWGASNQRNTEID